jgi:hypothetical protein
LTLVPALLLPRRRSAELEAEEEPGEEPVLMH